MSAAWCWCVPMATSPGAPMRSLPMRPRSSIACAACCRRRRSRPSASLHNSISLHNNTGETGDGHAADQEGRPELTLLHELARAALLARLGAAGALDVGGAEAEVQAGCVAVRAGEAGARRLAQHGARRADPAPQP